jgi:hypothetical protein
MLHLLRQTTLLGGEVLAIIGLLAVMGAWSAWWFLPRRAAIRWPIFAPILGIAWVTAVGLPLVRSGVGVTRFAFPLVAIGTVLTGIAFVQHLRTAGGRRLLTAWLRCRGLAAAGTLAVTVTLSAWLMTSATRSDVRDAWGSGDFGAYWVVADYLQQHGATHAAYQAQEIFRASDIEEHLSKHARLGNMTYLALLGAVLAPGTIHHEIAASIVAAMLLTIGLAQYWLEIERPARRGIVLLVLLHPFLYFLLYFTYCSQAASVALFLAGVLLAPDAKSGFGASAISGLLIGTALLHHPTILPVAALFWTIKLIASIRIRRWAPLLVSSFVAVAVGGAYLPMTVHELVLISRHAALPGWEWRGLIGSFELIGVRSVLGFNMPELRPRWLLAVDFVVLIGFLLLVWFGLRRTRLPGPASAMLVATALLTAVGLIKYFNGASNATHAVVKTLSVFAVFLVLLAALPVARRLAQTPLWIAVLTVLATGQLFAVLRANPQSPEFTEDFVRLTRRVLARSRDTVVQFGWRVHPLLAAPVARDTRRIVPDASAVTQPAFVIYRRGDAVDRSHGATMSEGSYYAVAATAAQ